MSKYISTLLLGIILFFTNCQKILFDALDEIAYTTVFEEVWQYIEQRYCCFDIKNVDWDAVYQTYAPQVDDSMDEEEFKSIIHTMLSELEDGSLFLNTPSENIGYEDYYLPYPTNLDEDARNNYYWGVTGYLPDSILYLGRFPDYIHKSSSIYELLTTQAKGLIIDVRSVGLRTEIEIPGTPEVAYLADAIQTAAIAGTVRTKTGIGTEDYSNTEFEIGGGWAEINYPFPIVLLCNRQTFSGGNVCAYAFSKIPGCTVVGDRTGGGNVAIQSFILSNGWLLNIPKTTVLDLDGNSIGNGFDPDIFINDDPTTTDKDEIIEKAIELLN